MKIKTFTGKTLPEALLKAKKEFGSDIILLESKEIRASQTKSGQKLVQVTVSVDEVKPKPKKTVESWSPPVLGSKKKMPEQPEPAAAPQNEFNKVIGDILARKPKELNQEKEILKELSELREQVSRLSESKDEPEETNNGLPKAYTEIQTMLTEKGVDDQLASRIMKRTYMITENGPSAGKDEIIRSLKKEMAQIISSYKFKSSKKKNGRRVVLLVGATGVGKTTTAMKLASFQEIYGKEEVVIISTDPYGPAESLKAFSKMNGSAVYDKVRVDELQDLIKKFTKNEVVIIDTPGQSPFAPNYLQKLEEYVKAVKPTEIFMVLAMNTDLRDLFMASALFLLLKPDGLILTKFDETTQPGKVLSIVNEMNLPVAATCSGKRIFMDIDRGNAADLINNLFEQKAGEADA